MYARSLHVPDLHGKADLSRNNIGDVGETCDFSYCGHGSACTRSTGKGFDLGHYVSRRNERIAAQRHGSGTCMVGGPLHPDFNDPDPGNCFHNAYRDAHGLQHNALFNVKLNHCPDITGTEKKVRHGFRFVSRIPGHFSHGFSLRILEVFHVFEAVFSHQGLASREGGAEI